MTDSDPCSEYWEACHCAKKVLNNMLRNWLHLQENIKCTQTVY